MAYPPENRVRVVNYGILTPKDPRAVAVPSVPGKSCKLHWLAAAALTKMADACERDTGIKLLAASGIRPRRWTSRAQYEDFLVLNYAYLVKGRTFASENDRRAAIIEAGDDYIAFNTPHQTGLCVDFGSGGLAPIVRTAAKQRETVVYKWLCAHAHEYGFTPYNKEPWHWEYNISKAEWEKMP